MMTSARFTLLASAALLLATTAAAQQPQSGNVLEQLLGGIFGTNNQAAEQTLESDWNQGERPFERRRQQLDARIDAAVRDGSMSRYDADAMRREYDDIVRLEAQYAADGPMQPQERSELRNRYRALAQRVDRQDDGQARTGDADSWQPLAQRTSQFEQRLAMGLRTRRISQTEATRLRAEWRSLEQLEARYQYGGIDAREAADLQDRYGTIDYRLGGVGAGGFGNDDNVQRWAPMETRIVAAQRAGRINSSQAAQLRTQIGDLVRLDTAYGRTGYSAEQRTYLSRRYSQINAALGYRR